MNLLSAFGGGLFIIPLIFILAAIWFFYVAYRARKSGMAGYVTNPNTGQQEWKESDKKLSYFEVGQFWFGLIFLAAFIATVLIMYSER